MKKIILNESDKKAILSAKEKAIVESFTKTFNSIKRIDEMDGEKLNEELPVVDTPVQPTKISREDMGVLDNVYNQLAQLAESPTVKQNPQAHSVILRAAQNLRQLTF